MGMDYTQQKLWEAVDSLVKAGTLQERLRAAGGALAILMGGKDDPAFPAMPQSQQLLETVYGRLTEKEDREHGAVWATTRQLSDKDAEVIAGDILRLFIEATRAARIPVGATETVILPSDVN